jgi:very-short-patch-repair endonuclease
MPKSDPEIIKRVAEAKKLYKFKNNMTSEEKTDIFIKRSKHIYGDKYDYSKSEVNMIHEKVTIICDEHGDFMQTPHGHMLGYGCTKCGGSCLLTQEEWIKKANKVHDNKYDYSKVNYVNGESKVTIICPKHQEFEQIARTHIRNDGRGCPKCVNCHNYSNEEWIEKAKEVHGDLYDYSKTDYANTKTQVTIICQDHKEFVQSPRVHLIGGGCPLCVNKTQTRVYEWLLKLFPNTKREAYFKWSKSPNTTKYLRFDFYIEEINCLLEIDGRQHFTQVMEWQTPEFSQKRDVWKMQRANENNISVIRVYQIDIFQNKDKWMDKNIKELLAKREKPENHYVAIEKRINLYDKHKELMKNKIIWDKKMTSDNNE